MFQDFLAEVNFEELSNKIFVLNKELESEVKLSN